MTVRIGITGPIGCGKSTVAGWFAELGATVIDADQVARVVVEPGEPALVAVLDAFGPGVRAADGSLDRAALGRIVFADPDALARLEAIIHPAVRPRILAALEDADRAGAPAVVIEAIKLIEGGLGALCDAIWLVTCDPAIQAERLAARGLPPAEAQARVGAQAGIERAAAAIATRRIDTSRSLRHTRAEVTRAYRETLAIDPGR